MQECSHTESGHNEKQTYEDEETKDEIWETFLKKISRLQDYLEKQKFERKEEFERFNVVLLDLINRIDNKIEKLGNICHQLQHRSSVITRELIVIEELTNAVNVVRKRRTRS
ncbi:hypothetical protein RB195_015603 [Necator americanus]